VRFPIILLLLLNALALAAIRGGLGDTAARGEAERLTAQLAPERIRLAGDAVAQPATNGGDTEAAPRTAAPATDGLPPAEEAGLAAAADDEPADDEPTDDEPTADDPVAGSDAAGNSAPPPPACLAWVELGEEEAARLADRLREQGVEPVRHADSRIEAWWVRIPPARDRSAAEQRQRRLHAQGIRDTFIVQEASPSQFAISLGVFKTERRAHRLRDQLYAKGIGDAAIEPRPKTVYRIEARLPPAAGSAAGSTIESAADGFEPHRRSCDALPPHTD